MLPRLVGRLPKRALSKKWFICGFFAACWRNELRTFDFSARYDKTDLLAGKSSGLGSPGDWQIAVHRVDYAFLTRGKLPMTNNVVPAQDFEKKCKQAEREHEARKLEMLLERVKKQIERRSDPTQKKVDVPKSPLLAMSNGISRLRSRSVIFER
jgi:hypothetical protein